MLSRSRCFHSLFKSSAAKTNSHSNAKTDSPMLEALPASLVMPLAWEVRVSVARDLTDRPHQVQLITVADSQCRFVAVSSANSPQL